MKADEDFFSSSAFPFGPTRLPAVYNADDSLKMRFEYADARMPVAMTKDGVTYYLGYDQVGTLKVVADASGNVIRSIEYDSFGNILDETNPLFAVPFGFAGGLHDRDTGLVRFGHRDYNPETGRWTAKDPILFAGGDTDLYGYCVNDPVNFVDLKGLSESDVWKIHKIFRETVDKWTREGKRHYNPGVNNSLRLLYMLSCGMMGEPYGGCGDQWKEMTEKLKNCSYDDRWSFEWDGIWTFLIFPHQRGVAGSDNPSDPTIIYDPWKDTFIIIYP